MSPELTFHTVDGIAIVVQKFPGKGAVAMQHKHEYSHAHFVASGAIRVWIDNSLLGDFKAPAMVTIKAGHFHRLMALEEGTVGMCIHNLHGLPGITIADYATLEDEPCR